MKHGTMRTLGVTALGAAFAAAGTGAASAASPLNTLGPVNTVGTVAGQVLAAPPVQQALTDDAIGAMPAKPSDVVSPALPERMAAAKAKKSGLLGGLPVAGDLAPAQTLSGTLPTDKLAGGLSPDALTGSGLPTETLTGGGLPTMPVNGSLAGASVGGLPLS